MSLSKAIAVVLVVVGNAHAQALVVPARCARYVIVPEDAAEDSMLAWNQGLSLAGCAQDSSIPTVRDADSLAAMIAEMKQRATPSVLIYLDVLQHAPAEAQLRAAYQIGLVEVSLVVRARTAIAQADDARGELHARLEPMLEPAQQIARLCFYAIVRAAAEDPTVISNEVDRGIVATSRELLRQLGMPKTEQEDVTPRLASP